jgi:hypothetical protein
MPTSYLSGVCTLVLRALEDGPCTAKEVESRAELPASVVDAALAELRRAGRAEEDTPECWRARATSR